MSVTLYYGSGSAYAWRVWLALEHKAVPHEVKVLSFSEGDLRKPDYTSLNPRQRVPTLVDGDFVIRESAAIMEYVEERWPQAPLFATDLRLRATQRRMIREADDDVGGKVGDLFEAVFAPPEKADAAALAAAVNAVKTEAAIWEPQIAGPYVNGDAVSAVDYTLYPHLAIIERFRLRKPEAIPADLFGPKLAAWMERMKALPLIQKTWPPHWR
ncbi:MAG: glutathione S-transferase family protein [Ferrovibrio sp.]